MQHNRALSLQEFRKKRAAMQRELDEIKDSMFLADREHKEETHKMEQKFLVSYSIIGAFACSRPKLWKKFWSRTHGRAEFRMDFERFRVVLSQF